MKKIAILLTPLAILAVVYGCSKDHNAPTFSTYNQLRSPSDVVATYNPATDKVDIAWNMADTSGVVDYVISVSDSSVFDDGNVRLFPTNVANLTPPFTATYDASVYIPVRITSTVRYFTVSAVFKNDTFNYFVGPRANIDSAFVSRQ